MKKLSSPLHLLRVPKQLSFRVPMPVRETLLMKNGDSFPVCPRCRVTMEWEYMSFCDRCGQALDWERYEDAKVIESL